MTLSFMARSNASATRAYYLRSDELLPGVSPELVGKGWERIGVSEYTPAAFKALTDGRHPDIGKLLGQRVGHNRIDGWDATFSAPKSISLAIEFSPHGEKLREAGKQALIEAFTAQIEPRARVRYRDPQNGSQSRDARELLAVVFPHALARPQDGRDPMPHAHWHLYVANWTHDPVRQKGFALNTLDLQKHLPHVELEWHRRFRQKAEALGYRTKDAGRFWEVQGVPRSTVEKFSERRSAITKMFEESKRVTEKLRSMAGMLTRSDKQPEEPESLREVWRGKLTESEEKMFRQLKARPKVGRGPVRGHAKHLAMIRKVATLAAERVQERAYEYRS